MKYKNYKPFNVLFMKKYLFLATVVGAAFTSCVNDNEAVLTSEKNPQPITFEVAKYKASSRAEGDAQSQTGYTAFPTNQFFGTFAYKSASINGTHELFMNNEKIGFMNNTWVALGGSYLWPEKGHVDFISYYPYSELNNDFAPEVGDVNSGDKNKLSFNNYTVNQVDLMYSDKAHLQTHNYTTYGHSGVPTLFRHALAKLNFKVAAKYLVDTNNENQSWSILVESIKLNSLHGTGSLHLQTTSPSTAGTTEWKVSNHVEGQPKVWMTQGDATVVKEWKVENGGQSLDKELTIFSTAADYYVLPQTFGNKLQSVTIKYYVTDKNPNSNTYNEPEERNKTLYFYDYSKMVAAWEIGKNITYNIIIDPLGDIINFDPAVSDWDAISGTLDI